MSASALIRGLLACPSPLPVPGVSVEVVTTAVVQDDWSRVVDDGTTGPVEMPISVGIIRHPSGRTLAVDAGMGLATREGRFPRWPLSAITDTTVPAGFALVERLDAPPDLVLLTHTHYDHVGGLLDFPGVSAWLTTEDMRGVATGSPHLNRELRRSVDWQPQDLSWKSSTMVLGRPARDVLGDGTVWYLSLPGHTVGAAAVLVRAEDGPWLFVGDTAWVDKHLDGTRRPAIARLLVDAEPATVVESLEWARWMKHHCPDLRVVAGHEPTNLEGLRSRPAAAH